VGDTTQHALVARFDATEADVRRLRELIRGDESSVEELESLIDIDAVAKYYKLTAEEAAPGRAASAIVSRVAARDCV
jgi:hypothetical protein